MEREEELREFIDALDEAIKVLEGRIATRMENKKLYEEELNQIKQDK